MLSVKGLDTEIALINVRSDSKKMYTWETVIRAVEDYCTSHTDPEPEKKTEGCTGATDRKAGEEERTESIQSNEGQGSRKVAKPLAESAPGGGTVRADHPRNSYNACSRP